MFVEGHLSDPNNISHLWQISSFLMFPSFLKTDHHDITEILLTMVLNTNNPNSSPKTKVPVQKSAAPLFYHPTFEVLWKYPMDASYTVLHNGSNLILDEVDCSSHKSQPLFCAVRETSGP
jgi:hypothetical protein